MEFSEEKLAAVAQMFTSNEQQQHLEGDKGRKSAHTAEKRTPASQNIDETCERPDEEKLQPPHAGADSPAIMSSPSDGKGALGILNILLHDIHMLGADRIAWKREHAAKSK